MIAIITHFDGITGGDSLGANRLIGDWLGALGRTSAPRPIMLPEPDLWLSPDHAIDPNGVLVPIKHLIDGATIAQIRRATISLSARRADASRSG